MTIDDDLDYMECRQMQRAQESRENIRKNIEDGLTFTTGGGIVAASAAFGFHVGKAATAKEQERTGKKPESHHTEALSHGLGLAIVLTAAYKFWGKKKISRLAEFITCKSMGIPAPKAEKAQQTYPLPTVKNSHHGCEYI